MSRRRHQTIADLGAIAICPTLIVLLLSSLVYFLILCIYQGGYTGRIGYIWFMFILGAVGIARLSIQESRKYALGYAAVLGAATFFVLSQFMSVQGSLAGLSPIINGGTIALVWFLADRITFDCTLIDEDQDASGRGLLDGLSDEGATADDQQQRASRGRGHQPGRTVLWLTAAALPIFGIGQLMLPQDERWQWSALVALSVYLFATLSLLVVTSFLGVRRYLRQRGVDMPSDVSAAWLVGGIALTAVILAACFLLPQPGKMLARIEPPQALESPDWLKPSRYGWGSESAQPDVDAPDAATTASPAPGQQPSSAGDSESAQSSGQPGGKKSGKQGAGGEKSGGSGDSAGKQSPSQPSSSQQSGESGQTQSPAQQGQPSQSQSQQGQPSQSKSQQGQPSQSKSQQGQPSQSNSNPSQSKDSQSPADESSNSNPSRSDSPSEQGDKAAPAEQGDKAAPADAAESGEPAGDAQQKATRDVEQTSAPQQPEPQSDNESGEQAAAPPADSSSLLNSVISGLTGLLRALIYVVLIGVLLVFAWVQRHEIAKAWQAFLAWLRGEPSAQDVVDIQPSSDVASRPLLPFAAFQNPLGTHIDPRQAVIVTYQATEAWWREHGQPRHADETPFEYARRLRPRSAADRDALVRLTDAYNRVVYGNDAVQAPDLAAVAAVWKSFANG